jgi:hypothetical protein
MRRVGVLAWVLLLAAGVAASAADAEIPPHRAAVAAKVKGAWKDILTRSDAAAATAGMNDDQRKAFYAPLVKQLIETEAGKEYMLLLGRDALAETGVIDRPGLAQSVGAAATNPRSTGLLERSGITDLVSLAVQGTNFLSADDTAVTVNLSAAALLCAACRDKEDPAALRYRAAGFWNRLAGSLSFGAKLPAKDITGFSGFPDTGKLFDAVIWDAKLRLIGDRDPRSPRWDRYLLGELGGRSALAVIAMSHPSTPDGDRAALTEVFVADSTLRSDQIARLIKRSLQVSVKFSGQHLTKEPGMNKYTGVFMADKGLGPFDGSLNVSYSSVQDVTITPGQTFTLKQWKVTAGFVGGIWRDVFVRDRAAELSLVGDGLFPVDGDEVPLDRKTTWKGDLQLKIPVSETLELPFSVTYTNDPNELAKKKYVTGRIGITYDFGSLRRLLQEMAGGKP